MQEQMRLMREQNAMLVKQLGLSTNPSPQACTGSSGGAGSSTGTGADGAGSGTFRKSAEDAHAGDVVVDALDSAAERWLQHAAEQRS